MSICLDFVKSSKYSLKIGVFEQMDNDDDDDDDDHMI